MTEKDTTLALDMMTTVCSYCLVYFYFLPLTQFPDSHSRYGYSMSPRRHPGPYKRAAPPDPHTFDYPASLKQYADWFRYFYPAQATEEDNADKAAEQDVGDGSKPRNGIKSKWEKYKKDFAATQVRALSFSVTFSYGVFVLHIYVYRVGALRLKTVMYCSFRQCLNTIGNRLGLPKNMIQPQNTKIYAFV